MKYGKRMIAISMAVICVMGFLAACKEENAQKVTFDPPEEERIETETETQMAAEDEILPLTGDFRVGGVIGQSISASFRDYEKASGVTVEEVEYETLEALLDGARKGEFDLLQSNYTDLAMMLGTEGMLLDMEGVLKEYLENDTDYYTNVLEAGRVNGELLMVIPCFNLTGIRVPEAAYESYGKPFETWDDVYTFYESLPAEARSLKGGGGEVDSFIMPLLDWRVMTEEGLASLTNNRVNQQMAFYQKITNDCEQSQKYLDNKTVEKEGSNSLFVIYDDEFFRFDELMKANRVALEGLGNRLSSNPGEEAVVVPYPGHNGLSIRGMCYSLVKNGVGHPQAAAYLQWLYSEEGQNAYRGTSYGSPGSYSMGFWTRKDAAEYYLGWIGSDGEVTRAMAIEKGEPILAAADCLTAEPSSELAMSISMAVGARLRGTDSIRETIETYSVDNVYPFIRQCMEEGILDNPEPRTVESFDDWGDFLQKVLRLYYQNMGHVPQSMGG